MTTVKEVKDVQSLTTFAFLAAYLITYSFIKKHAYTIDTLN